MNEISLTSINYHFLSTKSKVVYLYSGNNIIEDSKSEVKKTPYDAGKYEVKVTSSYANIYIYTL